MIVPVKKINKIENGTDVRNKTRGFLKIPLLAWSLILFKRNTDVKGP